MCLCLSTYSTCILTVMFLILVVSPLPLVEVGVDGLRRRILDLPMKYEVIYIIEGQLKSYPMVRRRTSGSSAEFKRRMVSRVKFPPQAEAMGGQSRVTGAHM